MQAGPSSVSPGRQQVTLDQLKQVFSKLTDRPEVLAMKKDYEALLATGQSHTDEEILAYLLTKRRRSTQPAVPSPSRASNSQDRLAGYTREAFKVLVDPSTTRYVGLAHDDPLPEPLTESEQQDVLRWMKRDQGYIDLLNKQRAKAKQTLDAIKEDADRGIDSHGNDMGDWLGPNFVKHPKVMEQATQQVRVRHLPERLEEQSRGKRGKLRHYLATDVEREKWSKISEEEDVLIPIRIEAEHDSLKLRDTFTWNLRDTYTDPRYFVDHLLADFQLPSIMYHSFRDELLATINEQISAARSSSWESNVYSALRKDCEKTAKRIKLDHPYSHSSTSSWTLEDLPSEPLEAHEELRILIKLDITLGSMNLIDQVEWDISDPRNSPEEFAQQLAVDLGLPGEFTTAIAHSIREQRDSYSRSLSAIEHRPGAPVVHDELKTAFLAPLSSTSADTFRPTLSIAEFTPRLEHLPPDELERQDKERDRDMRRKKRQTRGRQRVTLPDRDPVKTHRTLLPRPGQSEVVPFINKEGEQVMPQPEIAQAYAIAYRQDQLMYGRGEPRYRAEEDPEDDADAVKREKQNSALPVNGTLPIPKVKEKPIISALTLEQIGQHESIINGVWHCSNCGGPDGIVPGRRKGPAGEKTLCSECGKHWARFRKNRPFEYTTDPDKHRVMQAKTAHGRKHAVNEDGLSGKTIGSRSGTPDGVRKRIGRPPKAVVAARLAAAAAVSSPSPFTRASSPPRQTAAAIPSHPLSQASHSPPIAPNETIPEWLQSAMQKLRKERPEDRYEVHPRIKADPVATTEYRIRCLDCPGKLYVPGPGETLQNFDIHVKNRNHRANVDARLAGAEEV